MMAHSQHVSHVDLPILLLYCYNLLQFERGNQNSQGGGGAILATKLIPVGSTSVAVLVPGGPNLGRGVHIWCAMPNWKVRQVMFCTQLTKVDDKTVLQSVLID